MKTNNSTDTKDILDECQETLKAQVIPDPPDYGKQNFGYEFCKKHGDKTGAILFILLFVGLCAFVIVSFKTNLGIGESTNIDMQVSTTVIHHGVEKTDPSAFSKFLNKMIKGDPKIIVAFDSLMEAKRAATVAEQEERRQHIRDSLVQYIHRRDSIRAELLREDSLRLELEKAKKVKIDYIVVIDDGITKRTVNVNSVVDTLTYEVTTQLGKTFTIMSVESAKERQKEIDRTKDYYKHMRIMTEQIL